MTPRSFFIILLKIVGLSLILGSATVLPNLITTMIPVFQGEGMSSLFISIIALIVTVAIYYLIYLFLVANPEVIINKLKLDKGFSEESFSFKIHHSTVLKIAIIVIGGIMIVDSVPTLLKQLYIAIQTKDVYHEGINPNMGWIILDAAKVLIGYLLISYNRTIVNFIELKQRKGK